MRAFRPRINYTHLAAGGAVSYSASPPYTPFQGSTYNTSGGSAISYFRRVSPQSATYLNENHDQVSEEPPSTLEAVKTFVVDNRVVIGLTCGIAAVAAVGYFWYYKETENDGKCESKCSADELSFEESFKPVQHQLVGGNPKYAKEQASCSLQDLHNNTTDYCVETKTITVTVPKVVQEVENSFAKKKTYLKTFGACCCCQSEPAICMILPCKHRIWCEECLMKNIQKNTVLYCPFDGIVIEQAVNVI